MRNFRGNAVRERDLTISVIRPNTNFLFFNMEGGAKLVKIYNKLNFYVAS